MAVIRAFWGCVMTKKNMSNTVAHAYNLSAREAKMRDHDFHEANLGRLCLMRQVEGRKEKEKTKERGRK